MIFHYGLEDVIIDLCLESKTLCKNDLKNSIYIQADLCQAVTMACLSYDDHDGEGATGDIIGWLNHVLPNNIVIKGWTQNQEYSC